MLLYKGKGDKMDSVQLEIIQKNGARGIFALKRNAPSISGFLALDTLPANQDGKIIYIALDHIASITVKDSEVYYLIDEIPFTSIKVKNER